MEGAVGRCPPVPGSRPFHLLPARRPTGLPPNERACERISKYSASANADSERQRGGLMSGRQPAEVTALDASCMTLLDRVTGQIERVLTSAAGVATATASFCAAAQQAGRPLRHADLAALRPVVADVLREHDSL